MMDSEGVSGGCMSAKFAAICSCERRAGRMSSGGLLSFTLPPDGLGDVQLQLLLDRVVVGRKRRSVHVFSRAALDAQLTLCVYELATTDGVRGAAFDRHAFE